MSPLSFSFDLLLGIGLLWLAWRAITSPGRFTAVVLFMVFGFVMAIAWARLGAPDLALAEAAISAGITGALLLNACKAVLVDTPEVDESDTGEMPRLLPHWLALLVCGALGAGLAAVMAWLAADRPEVSPALLEAVTTHTLDNPVTVVLLDLRGYDTLLEMVVLLAAFLGVRVVLEQKNLPSLHATATTTPPMVDPLVAMATPVLLMTALFLFWTGMEAPGGAFQAGALLGALAVMHLLTGSIEPLTDHTPPVLRFALVIGLLLFSLLACLSLVWSGWPLSYPDAAAKAVILAIEFSLMVSIAVTLALLFAGTPGIQPRSSKGPVS